MSLLNEEDMAAARKALNPRLLRQSQLRQSMSVGSTITSVGSELDIGSGCQVEDEDDGDDNDDDDWSGENDSLDAAIVAALDGDVGLAVSLIPFLYKLLRNTVQSKVDGWQIDSAAPVDAGDGVGIKTSSGGSVAGSAADQAKDHISNIPRKRRRQSDSDNDRDDEDDDQGANGGASALGLPETAQVLLLACPFHKLNPVKYGIQHSATASSRKDMYRACAGPGFKSIQRLK